LAQLLYQWHRYGNLFKIAVPELRSTILQTKVDVAEDLCLPGLLMQEGFISILFSNSYRTLQNPSLNELERAIGKENLLVITNPDNEVGRKLETSADIVFEWAGNMQSHQFDAVGLEMIKAFYLYNGQ
jgi:hypothetical protein